MVSCELIWKWRISFEDNLSIWCASGLLENWSFQREIIGYQEPLLRLMLVIKRTSAGNRLASHHLRSCSWSLGLRVCTRQVLKISKSFSVFLNLRAGTSSWGARPRSWRQTASWSARRSSPWSGSRVRTLISSCSTRPTRSRKKSAGKDLTCAAHKFNWPVFALR